MKSVEELNGKWNWDPDWNKDANEYEDIRFAVIRVPQVDPAYVSMADLKKHGERHITSFTTAAAAQRHVRRCQREDRRHGKEYDYYCVALERVREEHAESSNRLRNKARPGAKTTSEQAGEGST